MPDLRLVEIVPDSGVTTVRDNLPHGARLSIWADFLRCFQEELEARSLLRPLPVVPGTPGNAP